MCLCKSGLGFGPFDCGSLPAPERRLLHICERWKVYVVHFEVYSSLQDWSVVESWDGSSKIILIEVMGPFIVPLTSISTSTSEGTKPNKSDNQFHGRCELHKHSYFALKVGNCNASSPR